MSINDVSAISTNREALDAFYREHIEGVERFVARRVGDPHLVADLVADIFVAAVEGAQNYRATRGKPIVWLYGIARNVMAEETRRRSRELRAVGKIAGHRLLDPNSLAGSKSGSTPSDRSKTCTSASMRSLSRIERCSN